MKKLFSYLPKKVLLALGTLLATFGLVAVAQAWFPNRPTYTIEQPAPHVTFNSITNNPNEGDERAFFEVKDASNTQPNGFSHTAQVSDGQELLLRVYVHNNAADNLNGTNFDGPGVAKNSKVRIFLPTATEKALRANAYITADNAQPKEVADSIDLSSSGNFSLEYVPGSAVQYTNAVPSGIKLNDSIVTTGAPVGYTSANGVIPGCFQYSSIVTVKVKVKMPRYSVKKSVRIEGQTASDWKETVTAPTDKAVEWRVEFKNSGATPLNQVKIVDQVPAGLTVVPGSVRLFNGNYPTGYTFPDSAIQNNGSQVNVNIGNYNPGINGLVLFKTRVSTSSPIECGSKKFVNNAYATPEGYGAVNDTAEVTYATNKDCVSQANYICEMLDITKNGRTVTISQFKAPSSGGAVFKDATINWGDGSATLTTNTPVGQTHTYARDGNFTVSAQARFTVNGVEQVATSANCAKPVAFTTTPPPTTPPTTPAVPGKLPDTGAGEVFGIFAATSAAGTIAHRLFWSRRFARGL